MLNILQNVNSYKLFYTLQIIENRMASEDNWKINKHTIFNCIDAFKQRCQDVFEICDAIIIYSR